MVRDAHDDELVWLGASHPHDADARDMHPASLDYLIGALSMMLPPVECWFSFGLMKQRA